MFRYFPIILWAGLAFLVFTVLSSLISSRRNAAKARQLGCKSAPSWPQPAWDFLGVKLVIESIYATKNFTFVSLLHDRQNALNKMLGRSVYTYKLHAFGNTVYFTSDPQNVQAMLAKQFHDFGLGASRAANFFPLLGSGIVLCPRSHC